MNLARTVRYLRSDLLPQHEIDALADWIIKAHEALKWYASADYGPMCKADAQVRKRAADALKGVE